jgi:isopenicillin-N epimerase
MSTSAPSTRRAFLRRLAQTSAALAAAPMVHRLPELPRSREGLPASRPGERPDETYWEQVKAQFLFEDRLVPLNAANMCPASRAVVEAVESATRDVETDVSFQNRAKYDQLREATRARLGTFLGATADEIAIVRNTSEANNIIVGGLSLGPGDEVVLWSENHPTNNVAWDVRAARFGFTVRRVKLPGMPASGSDVVDAFTGALTDRTRVLAFSDVSNASGIRMPSVALCRVARERGIYVHIDGAQTCGAARVSMPQLGCDSYTASSQKWLMGPCEAGVLYVRAERIPTIWPGVVGSGWGDKVEPNPKGARKFESLGQRNDAIMAGLAAALDLHDRIGIERVDARVTELGRRLRDGLAGIEGTQLVTPAAPDLYLGVIVTQFTGGVGAKVYDRLYRAHGVIGAPTGGLRLCPHVYNTLADVDRAVEAVRRALKEI